MKRTLLCALTCVLFAADHALSQPAPPSPDAKASPAHTGKKKAKKPMRMNEPMPTGMAKKGMMEGDVRKHALEKDAVMRELMKKDEMK